MRFLSKKSKIDNLMFVDLVNKQLEPHNLTYSDIRNQLDWFMKYNTTVQQQNRFIDWAVYYLIDNGFSTKKPKKKFHGLYFNMG